MRTQKVRVAGLRASDPMTLQILTQDLIRRPLIHLHVETLCDLIALSELDSTPFALRRDLGRFREQMFRELRDLPDGPPLQEVVTELGELPPARVPGTLRDQLALRAEDTKLVPETVDMLLVLKASFDATPADGVVVKERVAVKVDRPSVPESHKAPEERKAPSRSAPRAPRTPAAMRDTQREEWLRGDLLDRLAAYPNGGLKEAILVAGAKHRAPWNDIADDEVMSALRALKKDNKVNFSAGRWSLRGKW